MTDWQHDPEGNAYTLIQGDIRCRVWHTTLGTWAAVFVHHGISTAAYNFATPDDAKIWCEAQARGSVSKYSGAQPNDENIDATPHTDHGTTNA